MTEKNRTDKINKRGDIPTFILVIGIFLVCALTIISIVISSASFEKGFDILQNMAVLNSIAEQVRFYENLGIDPTTLLDINKQDNFYKISIEQKDDDQRLFYVDYTIPLKNSTYSIK